MSVDHNIQAKKKIEKTESEKLYNDNPSTMNRIAHYMDTKISTLKANYNVPKFDWTTLIQGVYDQQDSEIYKNVKRKLIYLNNQFNFLRNDEYGGYDCDVSFENEDTKHVNCCHLLLFFRDCRNQLLMEQPDINKLVNDLIICYYADKSFMQIDNRSILWNCFASQMIIRIKGKKSAEKIYNLGELKKQHEKILEKKIIAKHKYENKKDIPMVDDIEAKISITDADKKFVNKQLTTQKSKRLYYALLYIWLKINTGNEKEQWIKIGTNPKHGEISKAQIQRLSGLQHRAFSDAVQSCCAEGCKMIVINFDNIKVPKIKVLYKKQAGKEINFPDTCKKMRSWIDRYVKVSRNEKYEFGENSNKKVNRENRKNNKAVIRIEDRETFPSIAIAAEQNGINANGISACCLGRKNHSVCGGYHWMYLSEYQQIKK